METKESRNSCIYRQNRLKSKAVTRGEMPLYIEKGQIHQEDTIVNIYAPNTRVPKYITDTYRSEVRNR